MKRTVQEVIHQVGMWDFGSLLSSLIEAESTDKAMLCEGLCSVSMLSRICMGRRVPNKMMRDRLLGRMGVDNDRCENFLAAEEFDKWKQREELLSSVESKDFARTEKLLEEYRQQEDFQYVVEKQFYGYIKALLYYRKGADAESVGNIIEEALRQTVPNVDSTPISRLCLSIQECNLILEYYRWKKPGQLAKRCEEMFTYLEQKNVDVVSQALFLPKWKYYWCEIRLNEEQKKEQAGDKPDRTAYGRILRECEQALKLLSDSGKMYYLWELCECRARILERMLQYVREERQAKAIETLTLRIEENRQLMRAVEDIGAIVDEPLLMPGDAHLYRQQETYCIPDVIRIRREMYGWSKKELCDGICSEKTIGRIEARKCNPQMDIVRRLFEKLNLSGEYQRWEIVTGDVRVWRLMEQLNYQNARGEWEEALQTLEEIEQKASMDIPINKQFIQNIRASVEFYLGQLSTDEAVKALKGALDYTLSEKALERTKTWYLTNGEASCIHNMGDCYGRKKMNPYWEMCRKIAEQYEAEGLLPHISMYEYLMTDVASTLGNEGRFDESNAIIRKTLKIDFITRRGSSLISNLYGLAWNEAEEDTTHDKTRFRRSVENCLALSKFYHVWENIEFYGRTLQKI